MKVYIANEKDTDLARCHPWEVAASDPSHRYYDLCKKPWLIPEILKDFKKYASFPAIARFYEMVEWVNGPESHFESNDCAFSGITENKNTDWSKKLQCSGRLMIFYREIELNTVRETVDWLKKASKHYLSNLNQNLEFGVIGINLMKVRYLALPEGKNSGHEINFSFWAWGDEEGEVMQNLEEVISTLQQAMREIAQEINTSVAEG